MAGTKILGVSHEATNQSPVAQNQEGLCCGRSIKMVLGALLATAGSVAAIAGGIILFSGVTIAGLASAQLIAQVALIAGLAGATVGFVALCIFCCQDKQTKEVVKETQKKVQKKIEEKKEKGTETPVVQTKKETVTPVVQTSAMPINEKEVKPVNKELPLTEEQAKLKEETLKKIRASLATSVVQTKKEEKKGIETPVIQTSVAPTNEEVKPIVEKKPVLMKPLNIVSLKEQQAKLEEEALKKVKALAFEIEFGSDAKKESEQIKLDQETKNKFLEEEKELIDASGAKGSSLKLLKLKQHRGAIKDYYKESINKKYDNAVAVEDALKAEYAKENDEKNKMIIEKALGLIGTMIDNYDKELEEKIKPIDPEKIHTEYHLLMDLLEPKVETIKKE